MAFQSVEEQVIADLGALYDAERRFLHGQQAMLGQATNMVLQQALRTHGEQTRGHLANLQQIFSQLERHRPEIANSVATTLVDSGEQAMAEAGTSALRDCAICSAAGKAEHFEIACYSNLIAAAQELGNHDMLALLRQNLHQEQQTAQQFEQLASTLLRAALHPEGARTERRGWTRAEGTDQAQDSYVDTDSETELGALIHEME